MSVHSGPGDKLRSKSRLTLTGEVNSSASLGNHILLFFNLRTI